MRFFYTFLLNIILTSAVFAQFQSPVKWSFSTEALSEDEFYIVVTAKLEKDWHLYSQYIPDTGPIPTAFFFEENNDVVLSGKIIEVGKLEEAYDPNFDMQLKWFSNKVSFKQKVKIKSDTQIKGYVEYMVCDDKQCLPPDDEQFSFSLKKGKASEEQVAQSENLVINNPVEESTSPVQWSFKVGNVTEGKVDVFFKAKMQKGWHIYAQNIPDGGPIPTSFQFEENASATVVGKVNEKGKAIKKYDDVFGMDLTWFEDSIDFVQTLKISDRKSILKGSLEFMACNDEACLPPDEVFFEVDLSSEEVQYPINQQLTASENIPYDDIQFSWNMLETSDCSSAEEDDSQKGMWLIFLLGLTGGFIAILTPCVFPMIPLTVSFFTKGGRDKKNGLRQASIYGFSIIIIYLLLGLLVTGIFGADALNLMSTNPWFNLIFFILFVIFAFSFFGFYEITLPSSWSSKADRVSHQGGVIGIFFMAFTLSLVSFSCTGPIIGTLLVEAATGGGPAILGGHLPVRPLVGMFGFALALALPFTVFAGFPSLLKAIPQSGGWMNTVKVFLGFIELALAFKFLSVADLTGNWGFLRIEPFLVIWALIFLAMALYMFRFIIFPHDEKPPKRTPAKNVIGSVSLAFAIYLVSGFNYQPLKLLSGLAPPVTYNFFKKDKTCPANTNCFKDLEKGMDYARKANLPVLLDFTGYGCVNCRKMEENVWSDKEVNDVLQKYVVISLYVDDTKPLPEDMRFVSNLTGKEKLVSTVGQKWHNFQIKHFNKASQPFYVLVSPDFEVLNNPVAYMPDNAAYKAFLQCGINNFKATQSK